MNTEKSKNKSVESLCSPAILVRQEVIELRAVGIHARYEVLHTVQLDGRYPLSCNKQWTSVL